MTNWSIEEIRKLHRVADAAYEPIPTFSQWQPQGVDLAIWGRANGELGRLRSQRNPADIQAVLDQRVRQAAVDTGAIEGLYPADRGFTMSVAMGQVSLAEAEREVGGNFAENYEAQVAGFELAQDVATRAIPVSEALVRDLQKTTCAGQPSHEVMTDLGMQTQSLVLGEYTQHPNHVQRADGSVHAYAPVERVGDEMHRLVEQVATDRFLGAHCVVQAAYAHHALTTIHPFADGNGRVARLLASIWLLRGASIPFWVRTDEKAIYLGALRRADAGDTRAWVDFVARVSLTLLRDLSSSIEFEAAPNDSEVEELFRTPEERLGISERALHDVGEEVEQLVADELIAALPATMTSRRVFTSTDAPGRPGWAGATHRPTLNVELMRQGQSAETSLHVFVTTGGSQLSTVRIEWGERSVELSLDEVHPRLRDDAAERIRRLAGAVSRALVVEVAKKLGQR